ncbi:MAG: hypothetical protein ABIT05_02305 [Chitinophagaceae bacterium]
MEHLPIYISAGFIFTTALSIFFIYKAAGNAKIVLLVMAGWLALQAVVSLSGFYTVTGTIPPRFVLTILPPLLFIVWLLLSRRGAAFTSSLSIKTLTLLHIIRIPVEIGLYFLAAGKVVPELMTFGGRNFDIFSGITASLLYYFGFVKKVLPVKLILLWNFVCLALLANIVVIAILAAPFPFQQFAFDQPNIAVLYFPFVWLPSCVVPIVLYAHLASIKSLVAKRSSNTLANRPV